MSIVTERKSERGKPLLIIQNFKFYKQCTLTNGESKWRCMEKKCNSVVKTIGVENSRVITFEKHIHEHGSFSTQKLERQQLGVLAKQKRRAIVSLGKKPSHKVIKSLI